MKVNDIYTYRRTIMKKVTWKENRRIRLAVPDCFLPEQLINMADGTKKPIGDVVLGDEIQVFKLNEEELYYSNSVVWKDTNRIYANLNSQKIGQLETSIVNSINRRLHDDVYELHLESGKVLKPTGNHPLFTDKGWTTIDGHSPNHAGGSGYLKVGDKVFDINNNWVSVIDIVRVDGEYETFNLVDTNTNTIIADDILTHNTSAVISGTEEPIEMKVQIGDEEKPISEIEVGDIILSANIDDQTLVDATVTSVSTGHNMGGVILKVSTENSEILFTSTHLIPFYRDGEQREDNMGTLQAGDEVIVNDDGFSTKPIVSIEESKVIDSDVDVIHPHTDRGYHFVNNILVEG